MDRSSGGCTIDRDYQGLAMQAKAGASLIKDVVGTHPAGCPWRGFYRDLVSDVVMISNLCESGLGATRLTAESPAVLHDAVTFYLSCRASSSAYHLEKAKEKK